MISERSSEPQRIRESRRAGTGRAEEVKKGDESGRPYESEQYKTQDDSEASINIPGPRLSM